MEAPILSQMESLSLPHIIQLDSTGLHWTEWPAISIAENSRTVVRWSPVESSPVDQSTGLRLVGSPPESGGVRWSLADSSQYFTVSHQI